MRRQNISKAPSWLVFDFGDGPPLLFIVCLKAPLFAKRGGTLAVAAIALDANARYR
jgi:hypothetical protein